MFDPKTLDDLSRRLAGMFPPSARALQQDLENNLRAALSAAFAKLDLVTREEFDVQTAVLDRTRAKLKALEQRVARLEALGGGVDGASPPGLRNGPPNLGLAPPSEPRESADGQ